MRFSSLLKGLTVGGAALGGVLGPMGIDMPFAQGLFGGLFIGALIGAASALSFWSIPFGEMGRTDQIRL
ncbi:MAG TPA: hypothetical protein PLA85_10945 [Micropepsaceae bacterium]|nr:hypothetical protein [Micropepsaceae bacterium]HRK72096.1 hypothetical protein [Micropepsaceae bacterium]